MLKYFLLICMNRGSPKHAANSLASGRGPAVNCIQCSRIGIVFCPECAAAFCPKCWVKVPHHDFIKLPEVWSDFQVNVFMKTTRKTRLCLMINRLYLYIDEELWRASAATIRST